MKNVGIETIKFTTDDLPKQIQVIAEKFRNGYGFFNSFFKYEEGKGYHVWELIPSDGKSDSDTSGGLHLADVSVSKLELFANWLKEQKHEIRGGKKMYDVRYYRWLTEDEMYEYWSQRVYSR